MSGAKHTPEWRWERAGCRVYSAAFHRGRPVKIADVGIGGAVDEAELEARGRLIASAPDLLEALDPDTLDVAADACERDHRSSVATSLRMMAAKQRAAIAKATGAET